MKVVATLGRLLPVMKSTPLMKKMFSMSSDMMRWRICSAATPVRWAEAPSVRVTKPNR